MGVLFTLTQDNVLQSIRQLIYLDTMNIAWGFLGLMHKPLCTDLFTKLYKSLFMWINPWCSSDGKEEKLKLIAIKIIRYVVYVESRKKGSNTMPWWSPYKNIVIHDDLLLEKTKCSRSIREESIQDTSISGKNKESFQFSNQAVVMNILECLAIKQKYKDSCISLIQGLTTNFYYMHQRSISAMVRSKFWL